MAADMFYISSDAWNAMAALSPGHLISDSLRRHCKKYLDVLLQEALGLKVTLGSEDPDDRTRVELSLAKSLGFSLLVGSVSLLPIHTPNYGKRPLASTKWQATLVKRRGTPLSRQEVAFMRREALETLLDKVGAQVPMAQLRAEVLQQKIAPFELDAAMALEFRTALATDPDLVILFDEAPKVYLDCQGDAYLAGKHTKFTQMHWFSENEGRRVLSSKGRYPLVIMQGGESYDAYAKLLVWLEIKLLHGSVYVHPLTGEIMQIVIRLSGDMMMLQVVTGVAPPNSEFFCLYCTCSKREIANLDKPWSISRNELERAGCLHAPKEISKSYVKPSELTEKHLTAKTRYDCFSMEILRQGVRDRFTSDADMSHVVPVRATKLQLITWLIKDDVRFKSAVTRHVLRTHYARMMEVLYVADSHSSSHRGYLRPSLVPTLPQVNIMIDPLHMFNAIFKRLFVCLVEDACRLGRACLTHLEWMIRVECQVPDWTWEECPQTRRITWRALDGKDNLRVLATLNMHAVFDGFITETLFLDVDRRVQLWKLFDEIYVHLREWDLSCDLVDLQRKIRVFMGLFVGEAEPARRPIRTEKSHPIHAELPHSEGYADHHVTPYMHILLDHVEELLRLWETLMATATFAGEKYNHEQALTHFRCTNLGGGAKPEDGTESTGSRVLRQMIARLTRVVYNPARKPLPPLVCGFRDCTARYTYAAWLTKHRLKQQHHLPEALAVELQEDPADEVVDMELEDSV